MSLKYEPSSERAQVRCRASVAHVSQARPDSGLGFQVNALEIFQVVSSSLGSGMAGWPSMRREKKYFTEMCSGSEAGSYLRLIDFVYHSTLGLRVIITKKQHEM